MLCTVLSTIFKKVKINETCYTNDKMRTAMMSLGNGKSFDEYAGNQVLTLLSDILIDGENSFVEIYLFSTQV